MILAAFGLVIGLWILFSILFIAFFIPDHAVGKSLEKQAQFECPCGFPYSNTPRPINNLFGLQIEEKLIKKIQRTERRKEAFIMSLLFVLPAIGLLLVKDMVQAFYHKRSCLPYHVSRVSGNE